MSCFWWRNDNLPKGSYRLCQLPPVACLHGICWFWFFFNSSPATRKKAVCLKIPWHGLNLIEQRTSTSFGGILSGVEYVIGKEVDWEKLVPEKIHHFDFWVCINIWGAVQCLLHVMQPPLCSLMSNGKWAVTCN